MAEPFKRPARPATRRRRARRDRGARARRARRRALSRRAQSGAARGGRDARRAGAGAGRRRNRQDPRADHAHRPYPRDSAAPGRREILAVTFTNKAAREMKHRVGADGRQVVEGMPWLGTFHSIGVKILRRHAELVGLKPNFTILDVDDQIRLIKQLLEAENIDEKRWPARVLAAMIDGWKNRGLTPEQVPPGEAAAFANGKRHQALQGLSGAAEDAQRRRFRRSAAGEHPAVPRASRGAAAISDALQVHSGRRIPGHQRRAVSVAAAVGAAGGPIECDDADARSFALPQREREVKTSAASATTTSRSTAGAAPRSTTSCASRRIFPAPR